MTTGSPTNKLKLWLTRLIALHFVVTAITGLALYARPLEDRPGLYGKAVKEWLVMIHNGEWIGHVLFDNRWLSGVVIGGALAFTALRFARRALTRLAPAALTALGRPDRRN